MPTISLRGPKSSSYTTVVDDEDFDEMSKYKWYLTRGYASRTNSKQAIYQGEVKTIYLHLEIAKRAGILLEGLEVDHEDTNKLNNKRSNLRPATRRHNQANSGKHKDSTSGYKGVCWCARVKKWRANIGVNYKQVHLGYYNTAEEAYVAYCAAATKVNGNFAKG